jgi:hypothetical protein
MMMVEEFTNSVEPKDAFSNTLQATEFIRWFGSKEIYCHLTPIFAALIKSLKTPTYFCFMIWQKRTW